MTSRYVNESTSIVQLDGESPALSTIVFLSTCRRLGHLVTIRDQTGFISSPKRFIVSCTTGISFADGTSSLSFDQRFSYISLVSQTSTVWKPVNLPPLYGLGSTPTVGGADTIAAATQLSYMSLVSSLALEGGLLTTSSFTSQQLLTVDSILVGPLSTSQFSVAGNAAIASSFSTASMTTDALTGQLATFGSLTTGSLSAGSAVVAGSLVAGPTSLSSISQVTGNLIVGQSATARSAVAASTNADFISTVRTFADTVQVASSITVGDAALNWIPGSFRFTVPIAPSQILAHILISDSLQYNGGTVASFENCSSLSSFVATSLAIPNSNGSMTLSNFNGTAISTARTFVRAATGGDTLTPFLVSFSSEAPTTTDTLTFANGTTSNIPIQYVISSSGAFQAESFLTQFTNYSAKNLQNSTLLTSSFQTQALTTSSLRIQESLTFSGSLVALSTATINNSAGLISTLITRSLYTEVASTFTVNSILSAPPLRIESTTVATNTGSISSQSTLAFIPTALQANRITVGTKPSTVTGPSIFISDIQTTGIGPTSLFVSTPTLPLTLYPYHYRYGNGVPQDPVMIHATANYQEYWTMSNLASGHPLYFNITLATSTTQVSGSNSYIVRVNGDSTIFTVNPPLGGSTMSLYNCEIGSIPVSQPNPITSNMTPYIELRGTGNGLVVADAVAWVSYSTLTVDQGALTDQFRPEEGISFTRGTLRFPNALNATTIYNGQNDIRTRNLTYTGALFTPSDSTLKESIQSAGLIHCLETLDRLPLRRYTFTEAYQSTFALADKSRIGVITSEVAPLIPGAVTTQPAGFCGMSTVSVVDDTQLRYIHLGATKALQAEVAALRTAFAQLST